MAGTEAFSIASDQVALSLQNPAYASPAFMNATGNGTDRWKTLSYSGLADALLQGVALDASFGGVNTDNPDLSIFRNRGGKLLTYHGLADQLVPAQGAINYYARVAATMGGVDNVQQFERRFLVPGMGHCANIGSIDTGNPAANPPLPAPGKLFNVLTDCGERRCARRDCRRHECRDCAKPAAAYTRRSSCIWAATSTMPQASGANSVVPRVLWWTIARCRRASLESPALPLDRAADRRMLNCRRGRCATSSIAVELCVPSIQSGPHQPAAIGEPRSRSNPKKSGVQTAP